MWPHVFLLHQSLLPDTHASVSSMCLSKLRYFIMPLQDPTTPALWVSVVTAV